MIVTKVSDHFRLLTATGLNYNQAKGWWVVYRDSETPEEKEQAKSGWVPAGCLLETSIAPAQLGESSTPTNASTVAINPSQIVSVSTPGVALMDYKANGSDELKLVKGNLVRVYKRYNQYVCRSLAGSTALTCIGASQLVLCMCCLPRESRV